MAKKRTIADVAKGLEMKEQSFRNLLNGQWNVGPNLAQKIASYLGRPDSWPDFYHIPASELRRELGVTK